LHLNIGFAIPPTEENWHDDTDTDHCHNKPNNPWNTGFVWNTSLI
jgi:hypothetical protein